LVFILLRSIGMIKKILFIILLSCSATQINAQTLQFVGIPDKEFDYDAAAQENVQWCWAASIQMVLNYYGLAVKQDQVVEKSYPRDDDGKLPNWPATYELITNNLNNWVIPYNGSLHHVRAEMGEGAPSPAALIEELSNGRPVILAFETSHHSTHAIVVTGCKYLSSNLGPLVRNILARDPWPDSHNVQTVGLNEYPAKSLAELVRAYWFIDIED